MEHTNNHQSDRLQVDVAVRGQLYNQNDRIVYASNQKNVDWARKLPYAHRDILTNIRVGLGKQCFTIWNTSDSVCYSICQDPKQRPNSAAAVMVKATQVATNPRGLLLCMKAMMEYILSLASGKDINNNEMEGFQQRMLDCFMNGVKPQVVSQEKGSMAWLEYKDIDQFENYCFGLPFQSQMNEYVCVHLVAKDDHEAVGTSESLKRIDAKSIRTVYLFRQPEGGANRVEVSSDNNEVDYVFSDQEFMLTYKKEGYEPKPIEHLTSSSVGKYFDKKGNTICLKSAEGANIVFTKKFDIRVIENSNTKKAIVGWKYKIGDTGEPRDGSNGVHLPDGRHVLHIIAAGYENGFIEINTEDRNSSREVKLTAKGFEKQYKLKPVALSCKKGDWFVTITGKETGLFWRRFEKAKSLRVSRINWVWLAILIGLFMLVGGGIGGWNYRKTVAEADPSDSTKIVIGNTPETKIENSPVTISYEEQDIAYFNSHDIWRLNDLKSVKWRYFFEEILTNKKPWKATNNNELIPEVQEAKKKITHVGWQLLYKEYSCSLFVKMSKEIGTAVSEKREVNWNIILESYHEEYHRVLKENDRLKNENEKLRKG